MHSCECIVFHMQSVLILGRVFTGLLPARHGGRLSGQQRLASGFFFGGGNYSSLLSMSVIETSLYSSLSSMVSLLVMPCLSIFD